MTVSEDFSLTLARCFAPLRQLPAEVLRELSRHYGLLLRWNRTLNLTSIAGLEEIVVRHYCESLFLGVHLPETPVSVLDVGSGAGFPGIPVAVLRPDCPVTLAESHQRKAVFLREATRHLPAVRVAARRAEAVEQAFDWVVSRAVKWPEVLAVAQQIRARAEGAGPSISLLLGLDDASDATGSPSFRWQPLIPLPWGQRRVLLIGTPRLA